MSIRYINTKIETKINRVKTKRHLNLGGDDKIFV